MTGTLSQRQTAERRDTLGQMMDLDTTRLLLRSGASRLDAAAARVQHAQEQMRIAERDVAAAIEEGESYAEAARVLGMTRQSVRERYSHLRAV